MQTLMPTIRPTMLVPGIGGFTLGSRLWDVAGFRPSLDLQLATTKSLVDATTGAQLVTFTRASSGTFVGSDGLIKTATTNEPRFDHNPVTGESLGLLVEEQRTNSIRNNTMVGAVAGTSGTLPTNWNGIGSSQGLTRTIVGVGTENGISYIDIQWQGTLTSALNATIFAALESVASVIAANGQTWTSSCFVRVINGNFNGFSSFILQITERTSAGAFVASSSTSIAPAAAPLLQQRYAFTRTLSGGATVERVATELRGSASSGAAIDITLRIGLPQLEQGAFATSVIPTTTATVTRSADVASDTTRGGNIRSLFTQFRSPASGTRPVVSLDDNTANERIEILTSGTDPKLLVTDGGSAVADLDAGTVTANTTARIAARFQTDDYGVSIDGATSQLDTSGTLPTVNRIRIGSNQASGYLNGTIARITGWDTVLPNLPPVTQ
jgi:hypothetical protein